MSYPRQVLSVSARRTGRRLPVSLNSTARVYFGPFLPGERVESCVLSLFPATLVSVGVLVGSTTTTTTIIQRFRLDVRTFSGRPVDGATEFGQGRSIFGEGADGVLPLLAVQLGMLVVPCNFVATPEDNFLGLQVTELNNFALDGSVFLVLSGDGSGAGTFLKGGGP